MCVRVYIDAIVIDTADHLEGGTITSYEDSLMMARVV